jgi:glucose/mannose-6-phosphate isomerase
MSSILDNLEWMSELDREKMIDQINGFPDHLSSSLCIEVDVEFTGSGICLCGMGGSAISGDILADCVIRESEYHMSVLRGMELPGWVDKETLLIAVSYSGNTKEVLTVLDTAQDKGLNIVAVTSGGKLMEICGEEGIPYARVPTGFQPRAALGYLLGSTACILETAGVIPIASNLTNLVDPLKKFQEILVPEVPLEENLAKRTALDIEGTVPVVYAASELSPAARRWHTQINENSKMMAFTGEVPECNHNHIVGWMEGSRETFCRPVFLRSRTDNSWIKEIMSVTIDVLKKGGKFPVVLDFNEETRIHNLMAAIMVGDFVSYYLAMLNGVDPLPVESIQDLKRRMSSSI